MSKGVVRFCVSIFVAIAIVACFELGSGYLLFLEKGQNFYSAASRKERENAMVQAPAANIRTEFHPYYGFINVGSEQFLKAAGLRANNYGFFQRAAGGGCCDLPIPPGEREKLFVVGVFGNSIAGGLASYLQESSQAVQALSSLPAAKGKKIVVLNLALGGHHQPQELLTLTHVLAVGERLDLVITFGTTQEPTAGALNMLRTGLAADYPESSAYFSFIRAVEQQASSDPLQLAEVTLTAASARVRAEINSCRWASCVVLLRPLLTLQQFVSGFLSARTRSGAESRFFLAKTAIIPSTKEDAYERATKDWQRAVSLMSMFTRASGGDFWFFLVPTPWHHVSGKEPQVDAARLPELREFVHFSLPLLQRATRDLSKTGVHAIDATAILDKYPFGPELYIDESGHLGPVGMRAISEYVIQQIVQFSNQN